MKPLAYFIVRLAAISIAVMFTKVNAMEVEVIKSELDSELVPETVEYAVVAPEGYRQMKDLPLVLLTVAIFFLLGNT